LSALYARVPGSVKRTDITNIVFAPKRSLFFNHIRNTEAEMRPVDCQELYRDGRHYDLYNSFYNPDIEFYVNRARAGGGPVLELACGTGRLTIPIARAGLTITGLDVSPGMLARAREKSANVTSAIEWIHGDCRDFHLGRRFPFILFAFNAIAHLHTFEEIKSFFNCVREHLAPGGSFVLDHFNPNLYMLTRNSDSKYHVYSYDDPDGNGEVSVSENNAYHRDTQVNHITWYIKIGEDKPYSVPLNMRIFFPQELDALLRYNGFEIVEKYGDFDEAPFTTDSPRQVFVCR
jgi:SAM-dependent methyltransferase